MVRGARSAENRREMSRVAQHTSIPVATGERLTTKYEFADLLGQQAAAILQPALARVGGILEAKRLPVWPRPTTRRWRRISTAAHWKPPPTYRSRRAAQLPDTGEHRAFDGFYAEILKEPIQWEDGYIIPSPKPGIGIELDEEVAERYAYTGGVFPQIIDEPI